MLKTGVCLRIAFKRLSIKTTYFRERRLCSNDSSVVMKYLNVAEKNDAAKTIAGHLSRGTSRRREGISTYNKIYEFEATVFNQKCTMVMTSVSGHLLGYEFVGSYRGWQSCNPLSLFEAPVMKMCPEDYIKIKKTLEREIRSCQGLIIWTDCDREGENIGFEIIQVCTEIKPNLQIYRAKFSEITSTSVNRALNTIGPPNKNISDAVDVRMELDLRIGAAFTRFQTLRLQKVFPDKLATSLVSYGSCQFPTLGFVVERYRAVESFVSERFWKIKVSHTLNNLTVEFTWKRGRLFDEQACLVIHDLCSENPTATVQNIKSKPKSKWRPLPLDTIEMEKIGSRKLRINAKEVMKIAEKLYTQGMISYPRTETNIYPKELDLAQLVQHQTPDGDWGGFAQGILDSGGPNPRQGTKSDQAHPPIHPTKHVTNLSGDEKKVYELIVRSFLACCSKDAQGHETIVDVDIAGEKFTASGLMILARNYLDVYPYDKWSGKEIHVYEEGQSFLPTLMNIVDGQTSAPNLLTEADLISLMEKHGIGTDATHADHIETIKKRSYVALADNIHFVPGLLGMGLVEGYDAMGLSFSKPHLRAALEADLKDVCEGRKRPQDVLAQQVARYREVFVTVTDEANKIDQALSERFNQQPVAVTAQDDQNSAVFNKTVMKCPKCRLDMTLRTKKDGLGQFISCMGYPQCKNAIWFPGLVEKVVALDTSCDACGPSFKQLEIHWKGRSLEHLYPSPHVCCLGGCDSNLMQILQVSSGQPNRPNTQTTAARNTSNDSGFPTSTSRVVPRSQNDANIRNTEPVWSNRDDANTRPAVPNSTNRTGPNSGPQNSSWGQNSTGQSGGGDNSAAGWFSGTNDSGYNSRNQFDGRGNTSSRGGGNSSNSARGGGNGNYTRGGGNNSNSSRGGGNSNGNNSNSTWGGGSSGGNNSNSTWGGGSSGGNNSNSTWGGGSSGGNNSNSTWGGGSGGGNNSNATWGGGSGSGNNSNSTWGGGNTGNTARGGGNSSNSSRGGGNNPGWGSSAPSEGDDTQVVCNCGEPSILLTVRKQNENYGKQFHKCQKPKESGGCNFFLWATPDPVGAGPSSDHMPMINNTRGGGNSRGNTSGNGGWGSSNNTTSWGGNNNNNPTSWGDSGSGTWNPPGNGGGDTPMCNCNLPSKNLTVNKEGPNKGKTFFSCPNPAANRCNFFQWGEESGEPSTSWDSGQPQSRGRGRGRGRGASRGASSSQGASDSTRASGERAKKRCGICREEGHTRNKCPRQ